MDLVVLLGVSTLVRRLLTADSLFDVDSIRVGEGEATYRTERGSAASFTEPNAVAPDAGVNLERTATTNMLATEVQHYRRSTVR